MTSLAVKGPARPAHVRHKSSARATGSSDRQSDSDTQARHARIEKLSDHEKNDRTTAAFVRRVLCGSHLKPGVDLSASQSLDELLPPLTSSNEVDLQLYGIIAVILKQFVQAWYSKITPDHEFVDEIVQIIAHCTRGLEQRLRRVDLEAVLLDEIPELLNEHARAYRFATSSSQGASAQLQGVNARVIYHSLHPHPALSPVPSDPASSESQRSNEEVWRQLLIEAVLQSLLPPEDLQNPCLKVLVNEIFSEMIIGNVLGGKVGEGWFLWEGITKAIQAVRADESNVSDESHPPKKGARLEQFGLLTGEASAMGSSQTSRRARSVYAMIINAGWELLRIASMVYGVVRAVIIAFSGAIYLPQRRTHHQTTLSAGALSPSTTSSKTGSPNLRPSTTSDVVQSPSTEPLKKPIVEMSAWRTPANLLGLSSAMPWFTGMLSLIQYYTVHGPGQVGGVDARLDRLLSHQIATHILSPTRLPPLLRTLRSNLFPNNAMGAGKPPPTTAEEVAAIKRGCAREIHRVIPTAARVLYFGRAAPSPGGLQTQAEWEVQRIEDDVLSLLEDQYCNKHLLFAVVEVLVCRIFPELMDGSRLERS